MAIRAISFLELFYHLGYAYAENRSSRLCSAPWDKRPREGCIKSKMALFRRFLALIRVGVMQIDIIYYQKDIGTRRGPGRGPKRGPWDHIWDHFLKIAVFNDFIIKLVSR